jgi:tRNA 2-selenouridine synthase
LIRVLSIDDFLNAPGAILDVRSPSEYTQAHIPGAINLPLFTDAERAQVGICYKQKGREAAVELGLALTDGKLAGFVADAKQCTSAAALGENHSPVRQVRVHCWRGGMRSSAIAWLLDLAGFEVTTLLGGYKAFRNWSLSQFACPKPIAILGGMTGSGKTEILEALAQQGSQVLDLEAIASHRGSSFGALGLPPQPSTEQFENEIAVQWARFDSQEIIWIEAESKRIGQCRVPEALFQQMDQAPVWEITRSRSERIAMLVEVYGTADRQALITATERIQKRLGGQQATRAIEHIDAGQLAEAIEIILYYYDKTYTYDLQRREVSVYPIEATGRSVAEIISLLLDKVKALAPKFVS